MTLGNLILEILNRSDYKSKVSGSDKIYYGGFPYKVKLVDDEVSADWQLAADVNRWRQSTQGAGRFGVKSVSNWTKNFYFIHKYLLDDFVDVFQHRIDHIAGPISDHHADQLEFINKQNRFAKSQYVIKGNYYFNEYDMKLCWAYPKRLTPNYGYEHSVFDHFCKLGKSIEGVCDSRYFERNVYFKEQDLEDIEFFCKLKHGDVINNTVKIILIDNM